MDDLPPTFWQGVTEFNQGQYYACHDTLEALWMEATDPLRSLYQGILQIAVACYHLGNQNWQGAVVLLGEGISRLHPYEPQFLGVDIEKLVDASANLLDCLQQNGPEQVARFSQVFLWADQPPDTGHKEAFADDTFALVPKIITV
jgi:predicted metal-dependent hydrolase